jgi:hypothetical protein
MANVLAWNSDFALQLKCDLPAATMEAIQQTTLAVVRATYQGQQRDAVYRAQ